MNEDNEEFIEGFEAGAKAAHESLLPLLLAYMSVSLELERKLKPGEKNLALEKLYRELQPRLIGGKNENENFN